MIARTSPPRCLPIRSQRCSRTLAVTRPTYTPGATSSSQRVRCPRSPGGHTARMMTSLGPAIGDAALDFPETFIPKTHAVFVVGRDIVVALEKKALNVVNSAIQEIG